MAQNEVSEDVSTIALAKETRDSAKLGGPSKYIRFQKIFLIVFAILVAGFLELIIFMLISD